MNMTTYDKSQMSIFTKLFHCKRKLYSFEPDYCVRPSETIKEAMEHTNVTMFDIYNVEPIIGLKYFSKMMNDDIPINEQMAEKLSKVLGSEPAFWMNLSKNYHDEKGESK